METAPPSEAVARVQRVSADGIEDVDDRLAAEEPLGILLSWPGQRDPIELVVTMRTPGEDEALAVGYLLGEAILGPTVAVADVVRLPEPDGESSQILIELTAEPDGLERQRRGGYASSSCGLCGKATVAGVLARELPPLPDTGPVWQAGTIRSLPARMRARQDVFERTGGLHAAALFTAAGALRTLAEDIGRHNAVDKVIGEIHGRGEAIGADDLLVVSGRAGFEIAQKARVAGIAGMAAVGAPSSLAASLARRSGMTLIGFLRDDRFNVYAGAGRIAGCGEETP